MKKRDFVRRVGWLSFAIENGHAGDFLSATYIMGARREFS